MAILYGMSVKEFWEDDPDNFWAYRFSYYEKIMFEQEIFNNNAWLQGMYFCEGMLVAINNSFSKDKISYSEKPYSKAKEIDFKEQQKIVTSQLKSRISQVQAIKGEKKENRDSTLT